MKARTQILTLSLTLAACSGAPPRPGLNGNGGDSTRGPDETETPGTSNSGPKDNPNDDDDKPIVIGFNTALPRLTHEEWENTVRDTFLLAGTPNLAVNFSVDDGSIIFRNDSDINKVTTSLWKDYQEAAELVGKRISGNATAVKKLIPSNAPAGENVDRAKAILKPLLQRAFRRPATEVELKAYSDLFVKGKSLTGLKEFDAAGIALVTSAIIQSPNFIYHPEFGDKDGEVAKLKPIEVASRLSFAIWKSIPDQELFDAAAAGKLGTPEEIRAQVTRMFKDARASNTLRYFVNELFETKKFAGITKDAKLFPKFPNDLGDTMQKEAEMFIDDVVVKNNGGITKLLTASYTFANDKTAPLYDIALPGSMELTRVELDPKVRAGLITQLGWLTLNANPDSTRTIHRGFYVLSRIACDTLGAMFGTDSPPAKEFKTTRDRVTDLTSGCGGICHNNYINPGAFALEAYDAAGVYRTTENGNPIDTTGVYGQASDPDAPTKFKNAVELLQGLTKRTKTHECHVKRAIELLYNRQVNDLDREMVKKLAKESMDGKGTRDLMIDLLSDPGFLSQRSDKE